MYSDIIQVAFADNFKYTGIEHIHEVDFDKICLCSDTYYDERMNFVSVNTSFNDIEWYCNYLRTASYFARLNPDSYATYLLDIGYIPIVYVPACVQPMVVSMVNILNMAKIPFVRIKATSFNVAYLNSDMHDAWVHKLDIEKHLNIPIKDITSCEVVRRLYGVQR